MRGIKNIVFVLGYPITSIGKGTFAAHVALKLSTRDSCHLIKFDGVLNKDFSNLAGDEDIRAEKLADGTYGGYDFKTYTQTCPRLTFTQNNLINAGDLICSFIESTKGSPKALRFIPDLSSYFIKELEHRWERLGKPLNLVVEIGGIIGDLENRYVLAAITAMKQTLPVHVCVLTPLLFNEYDAEVKTRVVQETIQRSRECNLEVDYFLIRSHHDVGSDTLEKLSQVTGVQSENLVVFSYVKKEDLSAEITRLNLCFLGPI